VSWVFDDDDDYVVSVVSVLVVAVVDASMEVSRSVTRR
jgi:hypothetical protein